MEKRKSITEEKEKWGLSEERSQIPIITIDLTEIINNFYKKIQCKINRGKCRNMKVSPMTREECKCLNRLTTRKQIINLETSYK